MKCSLIKWRCLSTYNCYKQDKSPHHDHRDIIHKFWQGKQWIYSFFSGFWPHGHWQRVFTSKTWLLITITLHFKLTFSLCYLPVSSVNLGDNQKRWMVIGICLNKILLPPLRDVVAKKISKHYIALKNSDKIDTQVYKNYLSKDGVSEFNYGSINSNWDCWKRKKPSYNYNVSSAEELAKLYLEPKMAKFTGKKIWTQ